MNWLPVLGLASFRAFNHTTCSVHLSTPRCHWQPLVNYLQSGCDVSVINIGHKQTYIIFSVCSGKGKNQQNNVWEDRNVHQYILNRNFTSTFCVWGWFSAIIDHKIKPLIVNRLLAAQYLNQFVLPFLIYYPICYEVLTTILLVATDREMQSLISSTLWCWGALFLNATLCQRWHIV